MKRESLSFFMPKRHKDRKGRWRKRPIDNKYGHARALWKRGHLRNQTVAAGLANGWDKTKCPVLFGDLGGLPASDLLPIMRRVLDAAQAFADTDEYYPYMACVRNQVSVIANNPSTSGKNAHRFYFSGKDVSGLVFISWVRCIGEIEVVCAAFTVQCNY